MKSTARSVLRCYLVAKMAKYRAGANDEFNVDSWIPLVNFQNQEKLPGNFQAEHIYFLYIAREFV